MIIAEVNEQMPRTLGDSFIHVSRLNCIVPVNYPIAELIMGGEGNDDISQKIAGYIAELIPDGATMQMGIGGIPDAVLNFLGDKRDLGVHSEMFSDGVVRLVEKGVITNSRKTLHPGKIVAGFILGTQALYDWADDNPFCRVPSPGVCQRSVRDRAEREDGGHQFRHRGGSDRTGLRR